LMKLFHGGNGGSNPPGDANKNKWLFNILNQSKDYPLEPNMRTPVLSRKPDDELLR